MAFNGVFGIIVIGAEHLFCEFQTRRHLYERDILLGMSNEHMGIKE
jgi:hypothetical protein